MDPDFLVDPIVQLPYVYSRASPLRYTDRLGEKLDYGDEFFKYIACARRPGTELGKGLSWMIGSKTTWVIESTTAENSPKHWANSNSSNWKRPFVFKPGKIRVDTRDPSCESVVDGLAAEAIEAYAWGALDIPTDGSPFHPGKAHNYAEGFRESAVKRACTCACKRVTGIP